MKERVMNRPCPICFGDQKKKLYTQHFHNNVIALMDRYDIVVCDACGLAYADHIPSQEKFSAYYADMSKYEFNDAQGVVADDYVIYFKKIVSFISPHLKDKKAHILDIGCATGALLSIFKEEGYTNLWGIDPSSACVETAQKLYGLKATANNISNFDPGQKFDVIILSAIFEHLVDFTASMHKIRALLNDGGLLFIEVPDAERFDAYISAPFQQFSIEHINYFSQQSLTNLYATCSFDIVDMKPHDHLLNQTVDPDIFALAQKMPEGDFRIQKDEVSESKISNYIAQCREIDTDIKKIIHDYLSDKEKIIVWGVGTHTQRLIGAGLDVSKILYFVDSNTRYVGKKLNDLEIRSPKNIDNDAPILISTYSYQQEIADRSRIR